MYDCHVNSPKYVIFETTISSLTSNSHLTVPDHTTTDDSKSILLDDHTQTDDDYTWTNGDSTFLDCVTDDLNDTDLMDDADTRRKHDSILGRLGYDLSTLGIVRCASRYKSNAECKPFGVYRYSGGL